MKRCTECGASTLRHVLQTDEVRIGARVFGGMVHALECERCRATFTDGASGIELERAAATWLAKNGFAKGEEIRFMRKVAGLRAIDLAELLGVSAESVSHWETNRHKADRGTLATIGALALDAIAGVTSTRDRLRALREPRSEAPVQLGAVRESVAPS